VIAEEVPGTPSVPRTAAALCPPTGVRSGPPPAAFGAVARAVAGRPDLWLAALGALRRLAVPGWWRSRPRLPLPDGPLWRFRMITAYGRPDAIPDSTDVLSYLEWCRSSGPQRPHRRGHGRTSVAEGRRGPP